MDDERILSEVFEWEFVKLAERGAVTIEIAPLEAWCVLAMLQLACRVPANAGMARQIAERFARLVLQPVCAPTAALRIVAERGWQTRFDVEAPK